MVRMWINQPSNAQTFHYLHGRNVLATLSGNGMSMVYFLSGDVIS